MLIIDRNSVLTRKPRHDLRLDILVVDGGLLGTQSHIHIFADQSARNRVGVVTHVDRAAFANANAVDSIIGIEPVNCLRGLGDQIHAERDRKLEEVRVRHRAKSNDKSIALASYSRETESAWSEDRAPARTNQSAVPSKTSKSGSIT